MGQAAREMASRVMDIPTPQAIRETQQLSLKQGALEVWYQKKFVRFCLAHGIQPTRKLRARVWFWDADVPARVAKMHADEKRSKIAAGLR